MDWVLQMRASGWKRLHPSRTSGFSYNFTSHAHWNVLSPNSGEGSKLDGLLPCSWGGGGMSLEAKVVVSSETAWYSPSYKVSLGPVMFSVLKLKTNNLQEAGAGGSGEGREKERKRKLQKTLNSVCRVFMTCLSGQCGKPPINANNSFSPSCLHFLRQCLIHPFLASSFLCN